MTIAEAGAFIEEVMRDLPEVPNGSTVPFDAGDVEEILTRSHRGGFGWFLSMAVYVIQRAGLTGKVTPEEVQRRNIQRTA